MPAGKNKGIHVKFRKDRQCWEVVEYISGRLKRHATGYGGREHAEEKLAEIIIQRNQPSLNQSDLRLGDIMAYYIQNHLSTLPSAKTSLGCFERLIPFWGEMKLEDIKKSASLAYFEHRKKEFKKWQSSAGLKSNRTLSEPTVAREIRMLQSAINFCHKENIISVCPYIWRPRESKPRTRWLTQTEAAKLLNEARKNQNVRDYLTLFIQIGLHTGQRSKAILGLRWTDINFHTGMIDFARNYHASNKKGAIIPIPRRLLTALKQAKRRGTDLGYVINNNGKPIKSVKKSFSNTVAALGLEDVTPHTLRHTCVSWKIQKNQDYGKVGQYVGMSPKMVKDVYGHMNPEHLKEVANA